MGDHRNIEPAIYNQRRLNESPIPLSASQLDLNGLFDDSFNSENTEPSPIADVENSVVTEANSSVLDFPAQLPVHDHTNTTSDSIESENGMAPNVNPIENVTIDVVQNDDSTGRANVSVDEDAITETDTSSTNNSNNDHEEADPLATSVEISGIDLTVHNDAAIIIENVAHGNASDSAELPNVRDVVENGICENETNLVNRAIGVSNEESEPLIVRDIIKTEPMPIYENHFGNDNEIDDVLDDPIEEIYDDESDDVIIVIGRSGIPKPLGMTRQQTIKRENDPMSGNLTFSVSVRIYIFHM